MGSLSRTKPLPTATGRHQSSVEIACFGSVHIDIIAQARSTLIMESSNPGNFTTSIGGVAHNVAIALSSIGRKTALVSCIGDDNEGAEIESMLATTGIDTRHLHKSETFDTGRYLCIEEPNGELCVAVSDTEALDSLDNEALNLALETCAEAKWWFADANLDTAQLARIADAPRRCYLAVDTVSVVKAKNLRRPLHNIDLLFCNAAEASSLLDTTFRSATSAAKALAATNVRTCVVTNGSNPVAAFDSHKIHEFAVPKIPVSSVTGAGDSLIAGVLDALLTGNTLQDAVPNGITFAAKRLAES